MGPGTSDVRAVRANVSKEFEILVGAQFLIAGTVVDATATELNYIADVTPGTAAASKALVLGSSGEIATITSATITTLTTTTITSAALVLNSTNAINVQIAGISVLVMDDSGISFSAAADTAGKAFYTKTQNGGAATAGSPGQPGANHTLSTGAGTQGFDTENQAGDTGGNLIQNAGDGGRAGLISGGTASGGHAGGFVYTCGDGGDGGDASGNDGDGGSFAFIVGSAGSGGGGVSGVDGVIRLAGTVAVKQGSPTTVTTAATLTVAQMLSGIITGSDTDGATVALTLPTGTAMDAALPDDFSADDSFDIVIINLSSDEVADTYTLTANTGSGDFTIVGPAIIASSHADAETNAATFRCRKTAANTFVAYRIS